MGLLFGVNNKIHIFIPPYLFIYLMTTLGPPRCCFVIIIYLLLYFFLGYLIHLFSNSCTFFELPSTERFISNIVYCIVDDSVFLLFHPLQ
jgi:hypothetical protein